MPTVMIIDDSTMMRKNLRLIIQNAGFQVIGEASSGKNIVLHYNELEPDIITLDLDMPEVGGLEALETLMAEHPKANVVVISAQGYTSKVIQAIKLGAKSYLVKPVDPKKLLEVLTSIVK